MFEYNICTKADKNIFIKQCKALEKYIPNIVKGNLLEDIDGSETQFYSINGKTVTVHNSIYIDAVYVDSEIELEHYFK
ncbi:MAG: hypothetical protein IIZ46_04745 [Clostridia bacterium]|nr:hypothetical protein [Clostridia bacterium]